MKKTIISIVIILLILLVTYLFIIAYTDKIAKIENGEMIQVSESYMDR